MLTIAKFRENLGGLFFIVDENGKALEVRLDEVESLGPARPGSFGEREPFSLVFRGPLGLYLPQRIYRVEHEALGAVDVFLVPLKPDELGSRFEAIFN